MPKCPEWEAYFLDALEAATSCCGMAKAPFCGSIVVPCCTGKANEQHCFLDKSGTRYNTVCKGIYVGVSRRLAVPPEQDAQIVTGETNWQSKGIYIYTYSNDWQQKSLQNHYRYEATWNPRRQARPTLAQAFALQRLLAYRHPSSVSAPDLHEVVLTLTRVHTLRSLRGQCLSHT